MYNDKGTHLHCHIVPKYEGGLHYGSVFEMNPQPGVALTDEQYRQTIEKIKQYL
jgi:diadenosine tetraphosphate (Ap4A) HIT family hydrolase